MHYMTFVEENPGQDMTPSKLSLWATKENKLWIEVGSDDPTDYITTQSIALDLDDAKNLLEEMAKIVRGLEEASETPSNVTNGKPFKWVDK